MKLAAFSPLDRAQQLGLPIELFLGGLIFVEAFDQTFSGVTSTAALAQLEVT